MMLLPTGIILAAARKALAESSVLQIMNDLYFVL